MVGVVLTFSCMLPACLSNPHPRQSFNQSPILHVFLWYDMSVYNRRLVFNQSAYLYFRYTHEWAHLYCGDY